MIDIESYMLRLIEQLKKQFGTRLLYVGLQGSYLRGEANYNSDIDVMVILDVLSVCEGSLGSCDCLLVTSLSLC